MSRPARPGRRGTVLEVSLGHGVPALFQVRRYPGRLLEQVRFAPSDDLLPSTSGYGVECHDSAYSARDDAGFANDGLDYALL